MGYSQDEKKHQSNNNQKKKKKKKKKKGILGIILRIFMVIIIVGIFAVAGAFLGAYVGIIKDTGAINTEDITPGSYNSTIYDQAGNEIDTLHGNENREYVKLEYIPEDLQNAFVAIEDERFYEHNGIDIKGIMRAMVANIKTMSFSQGASTITQQLIKNNKLTSDKTLVRKIQEQYLAIAYENKLEDQLGSKKAAKDYILELYMNSIALNHGLYGVEAASEFYFGKSVSELNLAESACIAAITQNPSKYSPVSNPQYNKERQLIVLEKMLEQGYITQSEYNTAISDDIYSRIVGESSDGYTESLHSYFVDALIVEIANDLVKEKNMTEKQAYNLIYSGGLQIYSTVDTNMQAITEEAYLDDSLFPPKGNTLDVEYTISVMDIKTGEQTHHTKRTTVKTQEEAEAFKEEVKAEILNSTNQLVLDRLNVTESLQSAMVIMDYRTGEVKALVGGRGEKPGDLVFNRATEAYRSPGSSFKPLAVYGPAIDMGLLSCGSTIIDEPYTVNKYSPRNWNNTFLGPVTVRQAIRDSMNVVAVKTLVEDVGVDNAYNYLQKFGFTSIVEADKVPSMALGGITNGVSVLEMTAAYSTIANEGVYNEPIFYTKIIDHNGDILIDKKISQNTHIVLKDSTAFMLTSMMEDVITGGGSATGRLANFQNTRMHIAGKTGTTNDSKDLTFVGYTPYYCAGIWMGYDIQKPMTYDKSYHLIVWREVMEKIHDGLPDKEFTVPSSVTKRTTCSVSGKAPISGVCENDYFGSGTVSSDYVAVDNVSGSSGTCNLHKMYKIDTTTGMIASEYCPSENVKEAALAVDSNGNVINAPSSNPMNVNQVCTEHTSSGDSYTVTPTYPDDNNSDDSSDNNSSDNNSNNNNSNTGTNNSNNNSSGNNSSGSNNNSNNNNSSGNNNSSNSNNNNSSESSDNSSTPSGTMDDNLFIPG